MQELNVDLYDKNGETKLNPSTTAEQVSGLSSVATSGSYNDLINIPSNLVSYKTVSERAQFVNLNGNDLNGILYHHNINIKGYFSFEGTNYTCDIYFDVVTTENVTLVNNNKFTSAIPQTSFAVTGFGYYYGDEDIEKMAQILSIDIGDETIGVNIGMVFYLPFAMNFGSFEYLSNVTLSEAITIL